MVVKYVAMLIAELPEVDCLLLRCSYGGASSIIVVRQYIQMLRKKWFFLVKWRFSEQWQQWRQLCHNSWTRESPFWYVIVGQPCCPHYIDIASSLPRSQVPSLFFFLHWGRRIQWAYLISSKPNTPFRLLLERFLTINCCPCFLCLLRTPFS